jgi:hypothetical protein
MKQTCGSCGKKFSGFRGGLYTFPATSVYLAKDTPENHEKLMSSPSICSVCRMMHNYGTLKEYRRHFRRFHTPHPKVNILLEKLKTLL